MLNANIPFSEGLIIEVIPTWKQDCIVQSNFYVSSNYNVTIISTLVPENRTTQNYEHNFQGTITAPNFIEWTEVITSAEPEKIVTSNQVAWDIQLSNNSDTTHNYISLVKEASISFATIDSVKKIIDPNTLQTIPSVNAVYHLGFLESNESQMYRIYGTIANCTGDEIKLSTSSNCNAYPADSAAAVNSCQKATITLKAKVLQGDIQVNPILQPSTIDACDTAEYELEIINAGLGPITDIKVRVENTVSNGFSFNYNSVRIKNPYNANNYISIPPSQVSADGNGHVISLPSNIINELTPGARFRVNFKLITQFCIVSSGSRLVFKASANTACGLEIGNTPVLANAVTLNGAPTTIPHFTFVTTIDPIAIGCTDTTLAHPVRVKVINTGNAPTTSSDGFRMMIDGDFLYPLTPNFIYNPSGALALLPQSYLRDFKTGAGLAVGDSIVFTTTLIKPNITDLSCGTVGNINLVAFREFASPCNTTIQNCHLKQLSTSSKSTTPIIGTKNNYYVSKGNTMIYGNGILDLDIHVQAMAPNTKRPIRVQVYRDFNGNQMIDTEDTTVAERTFSWNNSNSGAWNTTYNVSSDIDLNYPGQLCPILVKVNLGCTCEEFIFPFTCNIVLPFNIQNFTATPKNCQVELSWKHDVDESTVKTIDVQRSTNNGYWETIAALKSQAQKFIDFNAPQTKVNYRLAYNTADGNIKYSDVATVNNKCGTNLMAIFPNPANDHIKVRLFNDKNASVAIIDQLGRIIFTKSLEAAMDNTIDTRSLPVGMYYLQVRQGNEIHTEKIDILR